MTDIFTPVISWVTITRGGTTFKISTDQRHNDPAADTRIFLMAWMGLFKQGEAKSEKKARPWSSGSVHNRYEQTHSGKDFKLSFFIRDRDAWNVADMSGTKAAFADLQYLLSDQYQEDHGRAPVIVNTSWGPYGPYTCRVSGDDPVADEGAIIYEVNFSAEESR